MRCQQSSATAPASPTHLLRAELGAYVLQALLLIRLNLGSQLLVRQHDNGHPGGGKGGQAAGTQGYTPGLNKQACPSWLRMQHCPASPGLQTVPRERHQRHPHNLDAHQPSTHTSVPASCCSCDSACNLRRMSTLNTPVLVVQQVLVDEGAKHITA
jgi:hypothetical protein